MTHPFRHLPEEVWRILFTDSPVASAIVGPDFSFREVNKKFCQLLQRDESQLVGRRFQEFTAPNYVDQDTSLAYRVLTRDITSYQLFKEYSLPSSELQGALIGVQGVYENGVLVCYYVTAIPQERKGTIPSLRDVPIKSGSFWREVFIRHTPAIVKAAIAVLAASYVLYGKWVAKQKDEELHHRQVDELIRRLEQLEKSKGQQ